MTISSYIYSQTWMHAIVDTRACCHREFISVAIEHHSAWTRGEVINNYHQPLPFLLLRKARARWLLVNSAQIMGWLFHLLTITSSSKFQISDFLILHPYSYSLFLILHHLLCFPCPLSLTLTVSDYVWLKAKWQNYNIK